MKYPFERDHESGMIYVSVRLDKQKSFKMVLDTGASNTTFDINALRLELYPIANKKIEKGLIETANGIVEVGVFEVESLAAFGHTVRNASVQVYDFLAHGIISDYDGVLGIDFFEGTEFIVNMKNQTIEVKPA